MVEEKHFSFTSNTTGRVDSVSSETLEIRRTVFSYPSVKIYVNGKEGKKSDKIKEGDKIEISYKEDIFSGLEKENIPLSIIYEDNDILVIDKAQGMAVHPAPGTISGTLCNALLYRYGDDFSVGEDPLRPGIVHRLDKDTSGVMVIAKTEKAMTNLSKEFSEHNNEKYYAAIVKGEFASPEGYIDRRITRDKRDRKKFTVTDNKSEGKDALTKYRVLSMGSGYSLLRVRIYTGRTHQIRVHMASINHPVLGDPIYSRPDPLFKDARMMLHSERLVLTHPISGKRMVFRSPLPERFKEVIEKCSMIEDAFEQEWCEE